MNDFYILLAQFFSTCLLQYFYICLGKIKQIKNSNAYENIDLGSLQVWSGCWQKRRNAMKRPEKT